MCDVLLLDTCAHVPPPTAPAIQEILLAGKILRNMALWVRTGIAPRQARVFTRGLLTIGAALRKAGFTVDYDLCMLDPSGDLPPSTKRKIQAARVVGVSSTTPAQPVAERIYHIVSQVNPKATVIAGGYHPSALPRQVLETNPHLDVIVRGEGEATMVELLQRDCRPGGVPGVAYRAADGGVKMEPARPYLCPQDLPMPDYSLLPGHLEDYHFNVSTVRGCSYRCAFCANWSFWGKPRYHAVDAVIEELRLLNCHLPPGRLIHFTDNVFTENRSRILEICNRLRAERFGLFYSCDIRAGTVDAELLHEMELAGFRHVAIGFEDADLAVLSRVNKKTEPTRNIETARLIRSETQMAITAYWMVGLPGTTMDSLSTNLVTVKRLIEEDIVDVVSPRIFVPYPGTTIFRAPRRFGVEILDRDWAHYDRVTSLPTCRLEHVEREQLYRSYLALRTTINEAYRKKLGIDADRLLDAVRRSRAMGEWAYS